MTYERELEEQFDWSTLKRDCVQNAVTTLHECTLDELSSFDLTDGEAIVGQAFLGTVFALTPSGKYYTPWANSNVDSCPECGGDGHARELCQVCYTNNPNDDIDCENCHEIRSVRDVITEDCQYCNGQGTRDLYKLAELRNETLAQATTFVVNTWNVKVHCDDLPTLHPSFDCNVCRGSGRQFVVCPTCNGIGSAEAYQDQLWYDALESVCDDHDMWHTASEGDPCDIMVARWVSFGEIARHILDDHVKLVRMWLDSKATIREVKEGLRVARSLINKIVQLEKEE